MPLLIITPTSERIDLPRSALCRPKNNTLSWFKYLQINAFLYCIHAFEQTLVGKKVVVAALNVSEVINNTNTSIPKNIENLSLSFTPKMFEILKILFKMIFVSTSVGLVNTAIKGMIEATPIISSNAIIKFIINNNAACLRSAGDNRNSSFLNDRI